MPNLSVSDGLSSDRKIFAISLAIFSIFILLPIVIYYFQRFYSLRHHIIIAKRHWRIIATQICCTILFLLIERPLAILFMNDVIHDTKYEIIYFIDRALYVLSLHIDLYLIVLRFWIVHYDINFNNAQNIAYWHGLIQKDCKIATELSPSHVNFYLTHNSTFGNLSYLKRVVFIVIFITITISYGSFLISYFKFGRPTCDSVFFLVDAFILFVPSMTAIIIIWNKTPTFHDIFDIKREMKFIFLLTVFGFIFYIIWVTTSAMMWVESYWIPNINVAMSCLLYFSVNILPIIWLFHCSKEAQSLSLCPCLNKKGKDKHRGRIRTVSSPVPDKKLALSAILSTKMGFESFMAHLKKEFSAENLVAVVEMIQFVDYYADKTEKEIEDLEKDYNEKYKPMKVKCSFINEIDIQQIKDYINSKDGKKDKKESKKKIQPMPGIKEACDENDDENVENDNDNNMDITRMRANTDRLQELIAPALQNTFNKERNNDLHVAAMNIARSECVRENINGYQGIILPSTIPQSSIVFEEKSCIKHKIIQLCDKYIINDAKLELNISSCCKENILEKKKKIIQLTINECKCIFNQCLIQIYDLMNGSLTRFRLTQEYVRFIEQLEHVADEVS